MYQKIKTGNKAHKTSHSIKPANPIFKIQNMVLSLSQKPASLSFVRFPKGSGKEDSFETFHLWDKVPILLNIGSESKLAALKNDHLSFLWRNDLP